MAKLRKPKVLVKSNRQVGKSIKSIDKQLKALAPGKRRSATGKIYYENRRNRSDLKDDTPSRIVKVKKHTRLDETVDVKKHDRKIVVKSAVSGSKMKLKDDVIIKANKLGKDAFNNNMLKIPIKDLKLRTLIANKPENIHSNEILVSWNKGWDSESLKNNKKPISKQSREYLIENNNIRLSSYDYDIFKKIFNRKHKLKNIIYSDNAGELNVNKKGSTDLYKSYITSIGYSNLYYIEIEKRLLKIDKSLNLSSIDKSKKNDSKMVTIYYSSDFVGGVNRIEAKLIDHGTTKYAQYNDAPFVKFIPKGKRKQIQILKGYKPFILIVSGTNTPEPPSFFSDSVSGNDVTSRTSKYLSHDERYLTDFNKLINPLLNTKLKIVGDYRYIKSTGDSKDESSLNIKKKKIPVKNVTILWAEGRSDVVNQLPRTFNSIAEANGYLKWALKFSPKTGGYDKHGFRVTWKDGQTYDGRYDLNEEYYNSTPIEKQIKDFAKYLWDNDKDKSAKELIEKYELKGGIVPYVSNLKVKPIKPILKSKFNKGDLVKKNNSEHIFKINSVSYDDKKKIFNIYLDNGEQVTESMISLVEIEKLFQNGINANMRKYLKKNYPNKKFSVRQDNSSIYISLMSANKTPFNNIDDIKSNTKRITNLGYDYDSKIRNIESSVSKGYWTINRHHINSDYIINKSTRNMFKNILNKFISINGYDYYINMEVGQWDKPFVLK